MDTTQWWSAGLACVSAILHRTKKEKVPQSQRKPPVSSGPCVYKLSIRKAEYKPTLQKGNQRKSRRPSSSQRRSGAPFSLEVQYPIHSVPGSASRVKLFPPPRPGLTRTEHKTMRRSRQRRRDSERPRLSSGNAPHSSPTPRYAATPRRLGVSGQAPPGAEEIPPAGAGEQPGDSAAKCLHLPPRLCN